MEAHATVLSIHFTEWSPLGGVDNIVGEWTTPTGGWGAPTRCAPAVFLLGLGPCQEKPAARHRRSPPHQPPAHHSPRRPHRCAPTIEWMRTEWRPGARPAPGYGRLVMDCMHRVGPLHVFVAHGLQGGAGVSVIVWVGDGVLDDADDAAGDAQHGRSRGVTRPVPQGGQQDAPDLVQGEGVRMRLSAAQDPRDGEDDVLGEPALGGVTTRSRGPWPRPSTRVLIAPRRGLCAELLAHVQAAQPDTGLPGPRAVRSDVAAAHRPQWISRTRRCRRYGRKI